MPSRGFPIHRCDPCGLRRRTVRRPFGHPSPVSLWPKPPLAGVIPSVGPSGRSRPCDPREGRHRDDRLVRPKPFELTWEVRPKPSFLRRGTTFRLPPPASDSAEAFSYAGRSGSDPVSPQFPVDPLGRYRPSPCDTEVPSGPVRLSPTRWDPYARPKPFARVRPFDPPPGPEDPDQVAGQAGRPSHGGLDNCHNPSDLPI